MDSWENGGGAQPREDGRVWLYSDGVYRWSYQRDLYRNRFEHNYVLKIVGLVFGLSWALFVGMLLVMGGDDMGWVYALVSAICLGGWLVTAGILLLVWRLSANARSGVDVVCFEMGEGGLRQVLSDQAQKADQALETMVTVSGLVSGNVAAASRGQDVVAGTHPNITSYADVRRIEMFPQYDLVDVTLKGNYKCRVYAHPEDLCFVRDYISAHAPQRVAAEAALEPEERRGGAVRRALLAMLLSLALIAGSIWVNNRLFMSRGFMLPGGWTFGGDVMLYRGLGLRYIKVRNALAAAEAGIADHMELDPFTAALGFLALWVLLYGLLSLAARLRPKD